MHALIINNSTVSFMQCLCVTKVRLSQDRERLWGKVESSREEYACLKQQHLFELEDQARRLTMAKVVR